MSVMKYWSSILKQDFYHVTVYDQCLKQSLFFEISWTRSALVLMYLNTVKPSSVDHGIHYESNRHMRKAVFIRVGGISV